MIDDRVMRVVAKKGNLTVILFIGKIDNLKRRHRLMELTWLIWEYEIREYTISKEWLNV